MSSKVQRSENWYKAVSKPRPQHVKDAISKAQRGRRHQLNEGFQKGHKPFSEKGRFYKGQPSWNKGTGKGSDPVKLKLRTYRANAKKKNMVFEVTLKQMDEFLKSECIYCGGSATGIDRIDNSKGYIDGNMQPCCGVCNHMKWNLTHEQFISKCKQIVTCVGYEI
jgi:hypothetical protein